MSSGSDGKTILDLEQKLFWFGLDVGSVLSKDKNDENRTEEERRSLYLDQPRDVCFHKLLESSFVNFKVSWLGIFEEKIRRQVRLGNLIDVYKKNNSFNSEELIEKVRKQSDSIDPNFQRCRIESKFHPDREWAFSALAGFGPTDAFKKDFSRESDPQQVLNLWFKDHWVSWREGNWQKFAHDYWHAVCQNELSFPETLKIPAVKLEPISGVEPDQVLVKLLNASGNGPGAVQEAADRVPTMTIRTPGIHGESPKARRTRETGNVGATGTDTPTDADQSTGTDKPAPTRSSGAHNSVMAVVSLICVVGAGSLVVYLKSPPAKATGDCVPGLGKVQLETASMPSLSADCSLAGEFRFPAPVVQALATVHASQAMPKGFVNTDGSETLSLSPIAGGRGEAEDAALLPGDFGPPLSPAGMLYSSRTLDLDLTCRKGESTVRVKDHTGGILSFDCEQAASGAGTRLLHQIWFDGLNQWPVTVTFQQEGKDTFVCPLEIDLSTPLPVEVHHPENCRSDTDNDPASSQVKSVRIPLRRFYPQADVYVHTESDLSFMRDPNRYANYRHWNQIGTDPSLSGLLQRVWSDTGDRSWRFATTDEVNKLLQTLRGGNLPAEQVASLFKGRLTYRGGYRLSALARDESCNETGFRRIGLQGQWPLRGRDLEVQATVKPCSVTDKDIGFWLVRKTGTFF